jgi:tripartite-type tricarboxylate transporter receptor subunit TctC
MMQRRSFLQSVGAVTALGGPLSALAQTKGDGWPNPNHPIRFTVAFAPGGPVDIIARILAEPLSRALGTNVVVENRGGAGGSVGASYVARAEPDGYAQLVISSAYGVYPSLYKEHIFDAEKDLVPVAMVGQSPNLLVASPKLPVKTLKDVIALAKTQRLTCSGPGLGTTPMLSAEYLFKVLAKVDVTQVPFNGAGPAMTAVMADQVNLSCLALAPALPPVKSGAIRGIAVTSRKRHPDLPDVPTVAEAGFTDFEDNTWVGLFVPAKTPQATVDRINREVTEIQKQADFKAKLAPNGFEIMSGTPAELKTFIHNEIERWSKVVKETGMQVS